MTVTRLEKAIWEKDYSIETTDGTRIALPAAGPWVCNPADPRVLACEELHIEPRSRRDSP